MAFQQYFLQEWKSIPTPSSTEIKKNSACFDCNICFEFASDPVITLCGHLYCWSCIYKWFDSKSSSVSHCPVCKAEISEKTMIPIYGRGQSFAESHPTEKVIPPRPTASGIKGLTGLSDQEPQLAFAPRDAYRQYPHNFANPDSNYEGEPLSPLLNLYGTAAMALSHQMFGEMVYARGFGSSDSFYSNQSVGSSTPTRLRRLELQADRSLNRVSIFLFCCFILCLLLVASLVFKS